MSSAAVEQVPAAAARSVNTAVGAFFGLDVEANINNRAATAAGRASSAGSARREQQAAVVVDIESGSVPPGDSSTASTGIFAHGDALAVLLGLVSVVCLTVVMGDLLNGEIPNATGATVFTFCTISSVAVFRRQRAAAAARAAEAEGGHPAAMLSTSHHPVPPRTLDREARRSLFDHFVFSLPAADRQDKKDIEDNSSGRGSNKEGETSTTTTTITTISAVVTAAAPVADSKVLPFEKTGLPTGASENWTTAAACVVCFGEYENGDRLCRLPCRHTYHEQCIDQWLDKANHPCCPMCKADLLALHRGSSAAGDDALAAIASDTANNDNNSNTDNSRSNSDSTDNSRSSSSGSNNNNETPQPAADLQEHADST